MAARERIARLQFAERAGVFEVPVRLEGAYGIGFLGTKGTYLVGAYPPIRSGHHGIFNGESFP
jgi:hypothetical protein